MILYEYQEIVSITRNIIENRTRVLWIIMNYDGTEHVATAALDGMWDRTLTGEFLQKPSVVTSVIVSNHFSPPLISFSGYTKILPSISANFSGVTKQ